MNYLYASYEDWKNWSCPFTPSEDEKAYFAGETRDLQISNADLLEIGFGSGAFLAWAIAQEARVTGSEINSISLEEAQARGVRLIPPNFESVADNLLSAFDTVVAFDVFEHFRMDEICARLAALEKMLRPGGHLLLRFPNAQSPFGLAPQFGDPTHQSALSRSVFELLIREHEFEIHRYGPSYRIVGGGIIRSIVRRSRYFTRDVISVFLRSIYATSIPYDPVVVLVLRKQDRSQG